VDKLKIPATMMTQHPDACKYISVQEEPEEAIFSLTPQPAGLGLEEVMVDFEGKLTPYQQTSQIVLGLLSKETVIPGKDVFVTPRIPSGLEEGVFRQLMALMSVVESNYHAHKRSGIYAIREVILPMTTGAEELLSVRERIIDVIDLAHKEFGMSKDPNIIEIIPLIETVPEIFEIKTIFKKYLEGCKQRGLSAERFRYMLGRSDLALSYGMVPAVLANKIALSLGHQVQKSTGVEILPILGGGTLPFRGHFTLDNIENTLKEYPGVRTLTMQSSIRYDHGYEETKKLAQILQQKLSLTRPLVYEQTVTNKLINVIAVFVKHYLFSFYPLMEMVNKISDLIPRQRDRLARKSEVGYARDLPHPEKITKFLEDKDLANELQKFKPKVIGELPRAISFTAALYSIGLPPEIIGTGRALDEVKERYGDGALDELLKIYPSLKEDLNFACRFVHLDNAREFLPTEVFAQVERDLKLIWRYLGVKIGSQTQKDRLYATILETMKPILKEIIAGREEILADESLEENLVRDWILKLGLIRGGLG